MQKHISYQEGQAIKNGNSKGFQKKSRGAFFAAIKRHNDNIEASRVKYQLTGVSVFCEDEEVEKLLFRIVKNLYGYVTIFARKPYCEKNIIDSIEQVGLNAPQYIEIMGEKTTLNIGELTLEFEKMGEAMFSITRIAKNPKKQ